jgi:hypothetical protein
MTRKEWNELNEERLRIYSGILFHNQTFAEGNPDAQIRYDFSCPEFVTLREKYDLERIAGKGSDFTRAKRLLHHLAPRLHHSSWYDNHVPCNALDLLEYSFDKPDQGINCLNKSKILAECCLALGIYARRVSILPYSPYDFDNHVVTEIYDRKLKKWIMLDITTDGYFVDEEKHPLSLLEIRHRFAGDAFVTFVKSTDRLRDLKQSAEKNAYFNSYICKNLFYFTTGCRNGFGPSEDWLVFAPEHFRVQEKNVANAVFRCKNMPEVSQQLRAAMEARLEQQRAAAEPEKTDISVLLVSPDGGK